MEAVAKKPRSAVSIAGWLGFGFSMLLLFTFLKLPEARLKNLIQGSIASALAPKGIAFSAKESGISVGLGIGIRLEGVEISPPPPQPTVSIERIDFAPSLFGLLFSEYGGKFRIRNAGGSLSGKVTYKKKSGTILVDLGADDFDLGKANFIGAATGIDLSALIDGEVYLEGDPAVPSTLAGNVNLTLSQISMKQQKVAGFPLPPIQASTGKFQLEIKEAGIKIQELRIGKPQASAPTGGAQDDLYLNVIGSATLAKNWESTALNLDTKFGFSQAALKPLALVEALLAPGKQEDGLYAYAIAGTAMSPTPTPNKPAGK
ncbi:MAG: type II secretion system protein GspN [Bdellovibrionota bacterium]